MATAITESRSSLSIGMLVLALCQRKELVRRTTCGDQLRARHFTAREPVKSAKLAGVYQITRTGLLQTQPDKSW
jgi:hypothetical protein